MMKPTWAEVKETVSTRLEEHRAALEATSEKKAQANVLRGQIAEAKAILAMGDEPRVEVERSKLADSE